MTLQEAIDHAKEVMINNLEATKGHKADDPIALQCMECAEEHRQLAEWLKELKAYKEQGGDAISRQAVMDCFKKYQPYMATRLFDFEKELSDLPSVTPQPKKTQMLDESNFDVSQYEMDLQSAYDCGRANTQQKVGRWITSHIPESVLCECSECGFTCGAYSFNYCPDCGCKMEVEE